MRTYPSLKQFLTSHRFDDSSPASEVFCHESDDSPQVGLKRGPNAQSDWEEWVDHVTDAWREVCTIRTAEQLDALPLGSILLTAAQNPVQKAHADGLWWMAHKDSPMPTHLMVGFQLVWHPDWSQS